MSRLAEVLGDEVDDAEEELFALFSRPAPELGLGIVNATRDTLEVTVAGKDLTIYQSPTVLRSDRSQGTTGAVVWKITPVFAEWFSSPEQILFKSGVLSSTSTVLELGCGVSGIVGLTLAPKIGRFIATDLDYVLKLLKHNVIGNQHVSRQEPRLASSSRRGRALLAVPQSKRVEVLTLDWESETVSSLRSLVRTHDSSCRSVGGTDVDCIVACDCVYNEALLKPFVDTCANICALRPTSSVSVQTICVVAQQLRTPDVFETWMKLFREKFRVWRVPSETLPTGLGENSGFVVHIGVLRSADGC